MNVIDLTTQPVTTPTDGGDDDLTHTICEDCASSYCGKPWDGSDLMEWGEYPDDCLVCEDLGAGCPDFCPRCGSPTPDD